MEENLGEITVLACAVIDTELLLENISTEEKTYILFQFLRQYGSYYDILLKDIDASNFDELWSLWIEIKNTFFAAKVTYGGRDNLFYVV